MTQPDGKPPVKKLNVAALVFYVEKSPYLYDSKNALFGAIEVKSARWEEIGAFFGIPGGSALGYWVKSVARYKFVLRKIIASYLIGMRVKADHIGQWFNVVGKLVGVSFEAIKAHVRKEQSLEENFSRMFRLD